MISAELVTHSGDDLLIANALRRSFGAGYDAWSEEPRTPRGRSDRQLIEDCAREGHLLPFRHPQVTLSCTAPLPIARQLGKHQVGMSWSETSRRYITKGLTFHEMAEWRSAPADKRQGSGERLPGDVQNSLDVVQRVNIAACIANYEGALALGASPEQARFLLPQSMDVLWTWTGSLLAWAQLWRQRHHSDTQAETREFADNVARIVEPLFPVSWKALTDGL